MKNTFLAFTLLLFFCSFSPNNEKSELKWLDWNTGYPLAKKLNKIILVDAYTDWCGWCKKMDRDTYSNLEIIKAINKDFVVIKFNPELENVIYELDGNKISGRELFAQLTQGKSTGFPTTYFIQPNKKQIQIAAGYLGPDDFIKVLEQALTMK
ncbi:MAG: DUF255 domain-containing protein [Bacteroidia bacterium]|nr:DUF255 domain-containing protein [Bacteroidia bacterium]